MRRYVAEAVGTFGVVFAGCGAAAVGAARLGDTGVALAFGLSLAAMTLILAPISGAHLNPAVTAAMALAGRIRMRDVAPYVGAQLAGGVAGTGLVIAITGGRTGGAGPAAEALANGYGRLSPGGYGLGAVLAAEVALTALLVLVLLSVSDPHLRGEHSLEAAQAQRPAHAVTAAAVGVAYTLIHLVGLPVSRLAASPARALGPALFAQGEAIEQLWVFLVAPVVGALLGAGVFRALWASPSAKPVTLVAAGTLPFRANARPPVAQPLDDDDDDAGPSTLRSPRPPRVEPTCELQ
jgi:aquaporin Z